MTTLSPCIGLCCIEQASGLCSGCARRRDEIAAWPTLPEGERARIWASLPARRLTLGIALHRLPWGAQEIRDFVVASLAPHAGTWVFGAPGAVAEFLVGAGETCALSVADDGVTAVTCRGAVHLAGFGRMRALAVGPGTRPGKARIIALVLPREILPAAAPPVLTDLGADGDALGPDGRGERLYDLGLGTSASRFCVRTDDPNLRRALDAARGTPWRSFLPRIGPPLIAVSPTRVVLTPVGRAEVFTPIPPPDGVSPAGPHTHLLPAALTAGHEAPPGLGIPAGYAVGALHYPNSTNSQDPSRDA